MSHLFKDQRGTLPPDIDRVTDVLLEKSEQRFFGKITLHIENGKTTRYVTEENTRLSQATGSEADARAAGGG